MFGIGYIRKGSGTIAAAFGALLWYTIKGADQPYAMVIITFFIAGIGVWSSSEVEKVWGHDSSRVVIDEIVGMCFSLFFIPHGWGYAILALALFRFFDIVKPLFIRSLEALKSGWGVMLDDVLAGIYTNLLMHAFLYFYR
jgi:phosphatidylglycerophosphatase A